MATTTLSDNLGIAWTGDFESLKQFVSEHLKVDGAWSSPGSDKKLFTSENVIISWRKSKGILLVSGEKAVNIVNELCKQICNGGEGKNSVGLPSNKSVDIYHDIGDLKCGQLTNSEAIQSLPDSVLHTSSVLSQFQDFMNTKKKAAFDESTETTSTNEYAKQAQCHNPEVIITPNVSDQLINVTVNNWNDEHSKKDPLADERAMELQNTGETFEQTTYKEVTASQPVLSATGEMSKNPVLNIPGGMTKKSKSDKKQSNDTEQEQHFKASEPPANKPIVTDDGFIGVERKQNKTKQLFLTGIAEKVKEYQIQSYLED